VGAMIYPNVVLFFCVILLIIFSTVLMPQLASMMKKTGQDMPLVTEILIKFTDFFGAWWWMFIVILVVAFLLFKAYTASKAGRLWWDKAKMAIPAFGPVIKGRFYAQFCHAMANLVTNGVPLLNGLKLLQRGTHNKHMQNQFGVLIENVGEGNSLARTMEQTGEFPDKLIDRVAIGEQTGELGTAFTKAAVKYDEELDRRISVLTNVLPTVMLVFVALIVGVVAYSIITTIFGSVSGMRSR
ncbi:MAG: type II secretion system F family protein, partial [Verrucomicrobiota bacterium]